MLLTMHLWSDCRATGRLFSLLLFCAVLLTACVPGTYTARPAFTIGDSTPCPFQNELFDCILEIHDFGYFAVNGYGVDWDDFYANVFLAPYKGVEVQWSGPITLVDLKTNKVIQVREPRPNTVVGGMNQKGPLADWNDSRLIGYGGRITADFGLRTSVHHMELRFPHVHVGDKDIAIPSIQIRQGIRLPIVLPAMSF
jgi:hypothetical protein